MADTMTVYNTAIQVHADPHAQKKITNIAGGSLYYKTDNTVTTSSSSIAAGSSISIQRDNWLICANAAPANILIAENPPFRTFNQPSSLSAYGPVSAAATAATDAAFTSNTMHCVQIWCPCDFYATGIGFLIGTTGTTTKVIASLHDATGAVLANSSATTNGTVVGTASTEQKLPFVTPVTIPAHTNVWAGLTANGTTAKFMAFTAETGQGVIGGDATQTSGTVAAITPPTTLTDAKAPLAFIY